MSRGVLLAVAFLMQILVAYGYIYEDVEYLDAEESKNFENLEGPHSTTTEDNFRLTSIPATNFNCKDYGNGYYADPYTNCQVYHFCSGAKKISFLCSPGTIFDEQEKSCNWSVDVQCLGLQERSKTSSKTFTDSRSAESTATPKRKLESVKPPNYEAVISINGAFNQNQRTTTPGFNHPNKLASINNKKTNQHDVVIPEKINDLEVKQNEDNVYRTTPSTERSSVSTSTSTSSRNLDQTSKIPQSRRGGGRRRTTERNREITLARTTPHVFENYPINTPLKDVVTTGRFQNTEPSFKVTTPNIFETKRQSHSRRTESNKRQKNIEINQGKAFTIVEQTTLNPRQFVNKIKHPEQFTPSEATSLATDAKMENYPSSSIDKNENTQNDKPVQDLNENKEIEASLKKPIKEVDIEEGNIDTTTIGVTRAASSTARGRIRYNKAKVVTHRTESRVVPDLPSVEIRRSTVRTNTVRNFPSTRNSGKGVQVIRKRPVTVKAPPPPPPPLTTTTENLDTTLFSEITDSASQTSQTQSGVQKRRSTLFTPRFLRDRTTEKATTSSRKPLLRSRPGGFRPVLEKNERKVVLKRREKVKMKQKPLKNENITTTVTTFNLEDRNANIFDLNDLIRNSETIDDDNFMASIVEAKRGLNSFNSENNRITLSSMIDKLRNLGFHPGRNTKEVKTIYDVNDFLSPSKNPNEDLIQHHIVEAKNELNGFTGQSTNLITQTVTPNKPTSTTSAPIKITTEKSSFKSRLSGLERSRNDQLRGRRKYKPANKIIQTTTYHNTATTLSHPNLSPKDSIRSDPQLKGLFDVNDILEKPAERSLNKGLTAPTGPEIEASTEINVVTSRTVLKSSSSRKFRPRPATKRVTFKPYTRRTTKIRPVQKDKPAIIPDNSNRISLPIPKTGSLNLGTTKKNSTKTESLTDKKDQYEFEIFPANNHESFDLNSGTPDMSFLLSYFGDVEVPSEVGSVLKLIRPSNSNHNNKDKEATSFLHTPSPTSDSSSYGSLFNLGESKKSLDQIVKHSSNGYTKLDVDNALERKSIREVSSSSSKNNTKLSSKISNGSSRSKMNRGLDINELLSAANHLVYFEPFKNETIPSTTRRPRKKHRQDSRSKFSSKKKQPESSNSDLEEDSSDTSFVYRGNIANIGRIINELLQSEPLPRLATSLSSSNT